MVIARAPGLELVEERPRRGLTERVLVASARSYVVSPEVLGRSAESMLAVREVSDQLELTISDELWPLPKYREILFPV